MANRKGTSLRRRVAYRIGSWALIVASGLVGVLPAKWTDQFGKWLGRLWMRLSRKHRERAKSNLRMCFPDWPAQRVEDAARRVFEHFGKTTLRFLRTGKTTDQEVLTTTQMLGTEVLDRALQKGRGVLLISAHLGNWERGAHFLALRGYRISVVARDANSARVTEIVNQRRRVQGVDVLSRGNATRAILERLRKNQCVAILPDQNTWEIYVPFFGFPAGTVAGPAVIHLRTGAPIIGAFVTESEHGEYRGRIVELEMPELTCDREEDVRRIMTAINAMIEGAIRETPDQWLWMHDRWKSAREQGLLNG